MDPEVQSLVDRCEYLMKIDDGDTSWDLINGYFGEVWNRCKPNSFERVALAAVYKRMMLKWH
jgi:hypothetical protein